MKTVILVIILFYVSITSAQFYHSFSYGMTQSEALSSWKENKDSLKQISFNSDIIFKMNSSDFVHTDGKLIGIRFSPVDKKGMNGMERAGWIKFNEYRKSLPLILSHFLNQGYVLEYEDSLATKPLIRYEGIYLTYLLKHPNEKNVVVIQTDRMGIKQSVYGIGLTVSDILQYFRITIQIMDFNYWYQ